jgi:hypothetical protein
MPTPRLKKKPPSSEKPSQLPTPKALRTLSKEALALQLHVMPSAPEDGDPHRAAKLILDELSNPTPKHGTTKTNASTLAWIRGHLSTSDLVRNEVIPALAEIEAIRAVADEAANYLELTESEIKQQLKRSRELRAAIECVVRGMRVDLLSKAARDELCQRWLQLGWVGAMRSTRGNLRDRYFLFQLFEYFKLAVRDAPAASVFTRILAALQRTDDTETLRREVRRHFESFSASAKKRAH